MRQMRAQKQSGVACHKNVQRNRNIHPGGQKLAYWHLDPGRICTVLWLEVPNRNNPFPAVTHEENFRNSTNLLIAIFQT